MQKKYTFYTLSSDDDLHNIKYVGVTTRKLKQRFYQHIYNSKHKKLKNTPVSKWIYNVLCKNKNVIISYLDDCNEDIWEITEKYWISQFKTWGFNLLNVSSGGVGVYTIEKRHISGIERSINAHKKRIVQLNNNGEYLATFESIKEICVLFNCIKSTISNVLKGRSKTSNGFYWVYEKDYNNRTYTLRIPLNPKNYLGIKYAQRNPITKEIIKIFNSKREIISIFYKSAGSNSTLFDKAVNNNTVWKGFLWEKYNKN